jgi:hypothetical protein
MFFFFVENPNPGTPLFQTLDDGEVDRNLPWMVIGKEYIQKLSGGYWRYLLLGPNTADGEPRLVWFNGSLQWIRRIADPVWEDRNRVRSR